MKQYNGVNATPFIKTV